MREEWKTKAVFSQNNTALKMRINMELILVTLCMMAGLGLLLWLEGKLIDWMDD